MIAHSYGGIPAAGAVYGLSKTTRRQDGKKGGVIGLIYVSAFVVPKGRSLVEFLGGKHAPYLIPDQVKLFVLAFPSRLRQEADLLVLFSLLIIAQPSEGLCIASPAIETFYNDVPPQTAETFAASLLPHAILAFESAAPTPAWAEPASEGKLAFSEVYAGPGAANFLAGYVQGAEWRAMDGQGYRYWA